MSASADTAPLFVEPARAAHVHDIRQVDARVYPSPWSVDLWRRELGRADHEACYVAASVRSRHVGHGGLIVQAGDGHIVTVAVDPAHQRRGAATQIMTVLAARAVALGLDALTLEVRAGNDGAQALYRRFGFAPAGMRPGYYGDDGEDALIMWAHGVTEPAFAARIDAAVALAGGHRLIHPKLKRLTKAASRQGVHS